jgi:long-chain acyl-CoA synthetase
MRHRGTLGAESPISLVDAVIAHAVERGSRISVRQKRRGIWQTLTWAELLERVRHLAIGLDARGVRVGEPVLLIAENGIDWVVVDLALQTLSVPVIAVPPESANRAAEICLLAGATVAICGGQEDLADLLAADLLTTQLGSIIVANLQRVETRPSVETVELNDVETDGADRDGTGLFEALLRSRDANAQLLVSADGRRGGAGPHPELATAGATCRRAAAIAAWLKLGPKDRMFPMLSLAIPSSRLVGFYAPLIAGAQIDFPENAATVPDDLRESAPTVVCASPRALALLKWASDSRAASSAWPARSLYRWAMRSLASGFQRGRRRPLDVSLPSILVGRPVVRQLGLHRAREFVIIEGEVPRSASGWFWALGVPVLETYGTPVTAGPALTHHGIKDAGTAGSPLTGVDVRIDSAGNLLIRCGDSAWVPTGDIAEEVGRGRIRVRGPASAELRRDSDGAVFVADLELALLESQYISDVAIDSGVAESLIVYVEPEYEAVTAWARTKRVPIVDVHAIAQIPAVIDLVRAEIDRCVADYGVSVDFFALVPGLVEMTGGSLVPRNSRVDTLRGRGIELYAHGRAHPSASKAV